MTPDGKLIPIPFTAPMVRAIYAGRKTETRRLVRWPKAFGDRAPDEERLDNLGDCVTVVASDWNGKQHYVTCPYGTEGDRLWMREAFRFPGWLNELSPAECLSRHGVERMQQSIEYLADDANKYPDGRYRAARFMPYALTRLFLDVMEPPTFERVRSITDEAAKAEGIIERRPGGDLTPPIYGLPEWDIADCQMTPRDAYLHLFFGINGRADADANPWVWVTKFGAVS